MRTAKAEYMRLTGSECGQLRLTAQRRACQRLLQNRTGSYTSSVVVSSAAPPSPDSLANATCAPTPGCSLAVCLFGLLRP